MKEEKLPFTPEWEKPTSVVDDFVRTHQWPGERVLIGMSMGGYLAPRAAAFAQRFGGVVACDVFYDMGASARRYVPGFLFWRKDMDRALTAARSVQTVVYDRESGGAEHGQLGAHALWHATLFDWLAEMFD